MPSYSFLCFDFVREAQDLHTIVIQGIRLGKIKHVKSDFLTCISVSYSEKVPLSISIGIDIILKDQIIFVVR